jgi:two-component system, chemotaxis family, sensor kinase CheA
MKKYYYGAVVFYLLALFSYFTYQYVQKQTQLRAQIDERLIQCAKVTDQLLPATLHTPATKSGSLTPEQDLQNRLALSRFSQSVNVKYVYSFVYNKEKVYFTSSSATPEELKSGEDISYFFDEYPDASPILKKAFETRTIQFDETLDQWGHFRSVFLPHVSPSGRLYITAADIEISNIDEQLHALFTKSLLEALFHVLILFPFFIAYRIQNKAIQNELSRQVAERTANLNERTKAVTRLLDNANQGFLSFSRTLKIENEYSKKCLEIFGEPIEGKNISDLLYPEDGHKREFFEQTIEAIFEEEDEVKVDTILSLLQHEFIIHNKAIHVVYKRLESNRFMLILTDITDKKNLEKNVERERNTLKMVVSVIANSDEFFELLEEYQNFLRDRGDFIDSSKTPSENLSELYRMIHTYKGLFGQKEFITTPQGLHKVESKLSEWLKNTKISNEMIQALLTKIDFELWLSKDLEVLKVVLGEEFMEKKSMITIDDETFEQLRLKIAELIKEQPDTCHDLLDLYAVIQKLKYKPIGEFFLSFPKYVEQIAQRLDKSLYPMIILDESALVAGEEFRGFAKSLIHVIRNSVDHGIESPEERVLAGKDENGTIALYISDSEDSVIIEVADDGRGIDYKKLKSKAIENGFKTASELDNEEALTDLLFEDYFSTKEEITDISGRGVGLATVRAELLKMGGVYHVSSEVGIGTRFLFFVPKHALGSGD